MERKRMGSDSTRLLDHVLELFAQKISALNVIVAVMAEDFSRQDQDSLGEDLKQMQGVISNLDRFLSNLATIRRDNPFALVLASMSISQASSSEFAEMIDKLWREIPYAPEQPTEQVAPAEADIASNEMVRKIISEIFKEMAESGKLQKVIGLEAVVRQVVKEMFETGELQKTIIDYLRQEGGGEWQEWLKTLPDLPE